MGNQYEQEKTLMSIRGAGHTVSSLLFMDAKLILALYIFLKRMEKEGILKGGEVLDFQKFVKATEGKFDLMNVPVDIRKTDMLKELDDLKIRYYVMPELDEKTGTRQIAVFTEDREKFSAWMEQKINALLRSGGERTAGQLERLTDRNTTIVSIPVKNAEFLEKLKEDFDALWINYARLPDLNVGDGCVQFLTASADLKKVEHWFQLYRDDMSAKGVDIPDMQTMTEEEYLTSAEMNPEEYMASGNKKVQEANAKYAGREKGALEEWFDEADTRIRSVEEEAYEHFDRNPEYVEVSIDKETLVDGCCYQPAPDSADARHFFASRIPGTSGNEEQVLILPKEQIFLTNDGKTYAAFLGRKERPLVLDASGKPVTADKRSTGAALAESYKRAMKRTQKPEKAVETVQDAAKKMAEKIPANPILAK